MRGQIFVKIKWKSTPKLHWLYLLKCGQSSTVIIIVNLCMQIIKFCSLISWQITMVWESLLMDTSLLSASKQRNNNYWAWLCNTNIISLLSHTCYITAFFFPFKHKCSTQHFQSNSPRIIWYECMHADDMMHSAELFQILVIIKIKKETVSSWLWKKVAPLNS